MFSLKFAQMKTSDGRMHTIRVGDVGTLLDDHQYRILKIIAVSGPVALKRANYSTYRSFFRNSSHLSIRAPQLVNQSAQTDPSVDLTDDPLAHTILQRCGTAAVKTYYQGQPYCLGDLYLPGNTSLTPVSTPRQ